MKHGVERWLVPGWRNMQAWLHWLSLSWTFLIGGERKGEGAKGGITEARGRRGDVEKATSVENSKGQYNDDRKRDFQNILLSGEERTGDRFCTHHTHPAVLFHRLRCPCPRCPMMRRMCLMSMIAVTHCMYAALFRVYCGAARDSCPTSVVITCP